MTTLVSDHFRCQNELVDAGLVGFRETVDRKRTILDGHVSSIVDGRNFLFKQKMMRKKMVNSRLPNTVVWSFYYKKSVTTTETTFNHWKKTQASVNEMCTQNVSATASLVSNISESNEQHESEIRSARSAAEDDMSRHCEFGRAEESGGLV
jgi:kinesin family protein 11